MGDLFDDLLNLEESYVKFSYFAETTILTIHSAYQEGFATGSADGARAGFIEGRIFGLEQGYAKFLEIGKLQGRASVWAGRARDDAPEDIKIGNPRAQKNIEQLELVLTHPPFRNDEEEVEEVEETLKKARAKVKVLERTLGEKATEETKMEKGESGQVIEI